MRHRNQGRRLSMDTSERNALFRNMVTSLLIHGRVRTTEAKAKEVRRVADKVISIGKRAPKIEGLEGEALAKAKAGRVHAIRLAKRLINDDVAVGKLFGEYATRYATRPGGYTRVVKAGRRPGDNAPMAFLALVEAAEAPAAS
jgi:large subunit ribosomal protein L17